MYVVSDSISHVHQYIISHNDAHNFAKPNNIQNLFLFLMIKKLKVHSSILYFRSQFFFVFHITKYLNILKVKKWQPRRFTSMEFNLKFHKLFQLINIQDLKLNNNQERLYYQPTIRRKRWHILYFFKYKAEQIRLIILCSCLQTNEKSF